MIDDLKRKIPRGATYNDIPEDYAYNQAIDDLHAKGLLMVWQPIETLPMTKETFIFLTKSGSVLSGWRQKNNDGLLPVGIERVCHSTNSYCYFGGDEKPTHWMPTPPIPKGDA